MLQNRWKGCIFFSFAFLLCNVSGVVLMASENSPSEFAKLVQSKQTRQARVCGADPALLSSLAGIDDAEVMVTIPNEQLDHVAEFQEEADLWVAANIARFLPATRITHVVAGDDVLVASSPGSSAYFLVPAMRNLRSALAAAGLGDRVKVSSALSSEALSDPAWSGVVAHVLRFLESSGSPLFLKSRPSVASDAKVDAAYAAMRALGVSRVPVIAADLAAGSGLAVVPYYYYGYGYTGGQRRSLATGTFCVALQNADPAALQAGLNWACGPGHADCSAIQPGGACYQQNKLPALASYAYNEYYQKMASTGATCSFNGTATTTTSDPSSGSCVFAGSSTAGGSNSSVPVGASPPTSLSPPTGFTPPVGSSPPSSSEFTPPSGFTPPAGGGFGPGFGTPPGSFNGTGSFGPSGTLSPYNGVPRGLSRAGLTALSAAAVAVLLVSMDAM
ncbi:glucan endo-1,3-beta-glucosidase 4-like [Miscanthus floridulus]|uniref:glucan endo-1,3-beta-glucosidase 4-like n=1 Tax=Miscanthus floridulus TaxID=154761 RepID=UPI003459A332